MLNTQNRVEGEPCVRCGGTLRYAKNRNCVACAKSTRARLRAEMKARGPLAYLPADAYPVGRSAALAMRVRRYYPEEPCKRGHLTLRDAKTGACTGCMERRPVGAAVRQARKAASVTYRDLRAREAAAAEGAKIYQSVRPCKAGHLAGRYVGGNACVACAAEASRRRHALSKKRPPAPPSAEQRIEDLFSDENNPD